MSNTESVLLLLTVILLGILGWGVGYVLGAFFQAIYKAMRDL